MALDLDSSNSSQVEMEQQPKDDESIDMQTSHQNVSDNNCSSNSNSQQNRSSSFRRRGKRGWMLLRRISTNQRAGKVFLGADGRVAMVTYCAVKGSRKIADACCDGLNFEFFMKEYPFNEERSV
ncbi:hypothetical protein NPIL_389891 [Nephila pilipes]|uniref:Uncharacterized protein n=1 Tax=Nephila pilipes TaxID=299642 RepID=A0A8X6TTH3_NEPPI|nr:hypothetical protein NPIL_389891 [Nephila pilipes]